MSKYVIICMALCCYILTSCISEIMGITVFYLPGDIETTIPVTFENMKDACDNLENMDTIYLDKKDFYSIVNRRISKKPVKAFNKNFDSRIFFAIDSVQFCIDKYDNAYNDKYLFDIDGKTIYILKKYTHYYDYFDSDALFYEQGIKKYGIPENYVPKVHDVFPVKKKEALKFLILPCTN